MRRVLVPLAFLLLGAVSAAAVERSDGWGRYHDPELGLSFQLPARIFRQQSPDARAGGTVFATADGRARLRTFGFVNTRNQTPRGYLDGIPEYRAEKFHYVRTTSRFFVASAVRDGMILYRRCNFSPRGDRRVGCLQLEYPQSEKHAWDDIVTRVSLSLRTDAAMLR